MKHYMEYICGFQFKFKMMGIRMNGPALVYGDNQSMLANTTGPDSLLKQNSNIIAFQFIQEGTAIDELRTVYI